AGRAAAGAGDVAGRDGEDSRGQAVLEDLQGQPPAGRAAGQGGGLAGEQFADPGTSSHRNFLPERGSLRYHGRTTAPGAQTERPGAVGPVRGLLGGTTSPAAFLQGIFSRCVFLPG